MFVITQYTGNIMFILYHYAYKKSILDNDEYSFFDEFYIIAVQRKTVLKYDTVRRFYSLTVSYFNI